VCSISIEFRPITIYLTSIVFGIVSVSKDFSSSTVSSPTGSSITSGSAPVQAGIKLKIRVKTISGVINFNLS